MPEEPTDTALEPRIDGQEGDESPAADPPRKAGRPKGAKNKTTIQREREAQRMAERERLIMEVRAGTAKGDLAVAAAQGKKLMKEIGFDFAALFAALAAFYQPYPTWTRDPVSSRITNGNPNYDEAKFKEYAVLAATTARDFASYESPKLSAVMVGQSVVTKIEVEGGMPDDFQAPPSQQFPPGTVVTAEDFVDVTPAPALPKVVNG